MISNLYNIADFMPDEVEGKQLSEDELLAKLPELPEQKIADLIIANRYLGMFPNIATAAMSELSKRRENGSEFAYEQYITEQINKLPKLNFDVKNVSSLLNKFRFK